MFKKRTLLIIAIVMSLFLILRHTGHRYHNPPNSPKPEATIIDFIKFFWAQSQRDLTKIPSTLEAIATKDVLEAIHHPKQAQLTWLGHSTFLIQTPNLNILTDPFFSERASPVSFAGPKRERQSPVRIDQLPTIDVILISHNHYDHLDAKSLKQLASHHPLIVVPPGDEALVQSLGFKTIKPLQWAAHLDKKNLSITALPAIHFSQRGLFDRNRSLWSSYALSFSGIKLFFSCDTAYGTLYPQLGRSWRFDYALLPIGAYEPKSIMSSVHITPEESIKIAHDLHAKTMVPMHWGTIPMAQEPLLEPLLRLQHAKAGTLQVKPLRIGESLLLNS